MSPKVKSVAMKALYAGGEEVLTISKDLAPHATGTMERDTGVKRVDSEGKVYVHYDQPYARRQHEDLELRHPDPTNPLSTPGRVPKFLEKALQQHGPMVIQKVAQALRDFFNGKG